LLLSHAVASMRIGRRAALALPLAPTAAVAATDATTVSYGPREADLYLQPGRRPVVALLHDSLTASRRSLDAVARDITARTAYHCVNVDYGGSDDVETAMSWLRGPAAAALGLKNNVVLIGHGVGGQLAFRHALRGSPGLRGSPTTSARLRGVVSVNAPLDLREARALGIDVRGDSPIALLPPAMTSSLRTAAWTAWEESLVAATSFSLVHGLADDIVPPALSTRFVVAAATGGIPTEYHEIKNEGHSSILDPASYSWRAARAAAVAAMKTQPRPPETLRMAPTRRVDTDREILIRTLRM
jgi:fermentation-respiration switch protein FrsA (DUF1100 family)